MELSKLQEQCLDDIMSWYLSGSRSNQTFILSGIAGSGKTTLISYLRSRLPSSTKISFASFTGKAASVLKDKLTLAGVSNYPSDTISTIHSLIYEVEEKIDESGIKVLIWKLVSELMADFIIIDEASMVPEYIYKELLSFGKKILFVGDSFQLPPVADKFNILDGHIDFRLHEVHRFAENNPITKVSMLAREQGYIPHGTYGDFVHKVPKKHSMIYDFLKSDDDFVDSAIICGFNKTRNILNQKVRKMHNYTTEFPSIGERVICLRNNKDAKNCPIFNGVQGTVSSCGISGRYLDMMIKIDGERRYYKGKVSKRAFNNDSPKMDEFIMEDWDGNDYEEYPTNKRKKRKKYLDYFDYGYCLTAHKSQGSEWDNVMVIEQPCQYWEGDEWARWLYTCVTRAKNRLLIVR